MMNERKKSRPGIGMRTKVRRAYLEELRSGQYKQGHTVLRTEDDAFSCLGVLCNLHAKTHKRIAAREFDKCSYMGFTELPGDKVQKWAGLTWDDLVALAIRNDAHEYNFAQIADFVEYGTVPEHLAAQKVENTEQILRARIATLEAERSELVSRLEEIAQIADYW